MFQIYNADAKVNDSKPYSCYDHYSDAFCDKQLGKTETNVTDDSTNVTNESTKDTSSNTIPNVTRESIDSLESTKSTLEKELVKLNTDLVLKDASILSFESKVNLAKYEESQAKELYRTDQTEETRLSLVAAEEKLTLAESDLEASRTERNDILSKIISTKTAIVNLTKEIADAEKNFTIVKKTPSNTMQTVVVKLSKNCITMIKNNLKTSCPSYADLMALNLDTSDKRSGIFSNYDGYYHREKSLLKNDDRLYNLNDYNVIIDPSAALQQRAKTITIESNFDTYLLADDMTKKQNTRILHKDRYVDSCKDAVINSKTWLKTIADTIQYLRGGCHGTLLNTIEVITDNSTITKIDTSNKWKHDQWIKEIKESHKTLKINNDNSTNKAVIEDEDQ